MHTLSVKEVTHYYGKYKALNAVSFTINNGITALLGNNGAGKTTLINIIVGLLKCNSGKIIFDNLDINKDGRSYRESIGFLPQECGFYDNYTAFQFLQYMGYMKNVEPKMCLTRIEQYMKILGLWEHRNKKIRYYSGGMKHRLGIVQAILNEPPLLILDEPTTGLDFIERKAFKKMITEYSKEHIVIISTHILSDVEDISSHVIIIKDGEKIIDDNVKECNLTDKYRLIFEGENNEI